VTVRVPEVVSEAAASSVTAPVLTPPMTAVSLTPVMVTVTTRVVPSAVTAVKLSVSVSPARRAWIAAWVVLAA
jgi:hypothetical protein